MSSAKGGDLAQYVLNNEEPLTSDNYNEIDGLVFSQLSYSKFESPSITWSREELERSISVKDFAKRILEIDAIEEDTYENVKKMLNFSDITV